MKDEARRGMRQLLRGEFALQLVRGEPGVGLARRVGPPTRSPRLVLISAWDGGTRRVLEWMTCIGYSWHMI
jgi:hypothetical protein